MEQRDIPFLTVAELSRLIESREVSPVEVTQAYLDRIDGLDSSSTPTWPSRGARP